MSAATCSAPSPTCSRRRAPSRSPPASSTCGCTRPRRRPQRHAALAAEHGPRFLVGIGVSHGPLIDRVKEAGTYQKPLQQMQTYLDGLDAADPPLAAADRALAALGPKMLELARTRTAGAHPYLVTPEHSRIAREALGPDALVATEQARRAGHRPRVGPGRRRAPTSPRTCRCPTTRNNWRRLGFTEDDLADGGSDGLVDALVVWGDETAIAARVQEHRDAGASHVCVQVLGGDRLDVPPRRLPCARARPHVTYDFDRFLRHDELTAWLHDARRRPPGPRQRRVVRPQPRGTRPVDRHRHRCVDGPPRRQAGPLGRRQHPRRRADGHRGGVRAPPAPRRRSRLR